MGAILTRIDGSDRRVRLPDGRHRRLVSPDVSLRTQPTVIMILVDEHAATGHGLAASAATQPRVAIGPAGAVLITLRPNPGEQIVQLPAELPIRQLSDQGRCK